MRNYQLVPELVFRTPSLSFSELDDNFKHTKSEDEFVNILKKYCKTPVINESIFLASPNLHSELEKWLRGDIKKSKELEKLQYSLFRYLIRMSTRCTPFGLFSGVNKGEWDTETSVLLNGLFDNKRVTHLDMDLLDSLMRHFVNYIEVRPLLRFSLNTSIYSIGDEIRYVEYGFADSRRYKISSIENSEYVAKVLKEAESWAYYDDLANCLLDDDISFDAAYDFVNEMIDSQLLISELEPSLTDANNLNHLLSKVREVYENYDGDKGKLLVWKTTLEYIHRSIRKLDVNTQGNQIRSYMLIADSFKKLNMEVDLKKLFQVTLIKTYDSCKLTHQVAETVRKSIDILNRLSSDAPTSNMDKFKSAFLARFEHREMPLLYVLDTEVGLGYPINEGHSKDVTPLVDDIPIANKNERSQSLPWDQKQEFLLSKYLKAKSENAYKVFIEDKEVKMFVPNWDNLPTTLAATGSVFNSDPSDKSNFKVLINGVGGSSAANLIGRFTHIDRDVYNIAKNITEYEQKMNSRAILAEILHLPEARTGNILLRAKLRDYEIPFLSRTSAPKRYQIHLQDLFVSIKEDKVFLRSKKLDREIVPCLTTAHNFYQSSLPVYRFLCDIQHQNIKPGLSFSWGSLSSYYKFLPRVEYRNAILSRASWQLDSNDILSMARDETNTLLERIRSWRKRWQMPQFVVVAEDDNELFIDLDNIFYVKLLIGEAKKKKSLILKESLLSCDNAIVNDVDEKSYTNEFVAMFTKKEHKYEYQDLQSAESEPLVAAATREFVLGSEWLYYKLYMGEKTSDKILLDNIASLIIKLKEEKLINKWFFIRYNDPDFHLRLRLNLCNKKDTGKVINEVFSCLSTPYNDGFIWKIQADVYQREIERYGANTISLVEGIFSDNSDFSLMILSLVNGTVNEDRIRWLCLLKATDTMLSHFGYTLKAKEALLEKIKNSFLSEFGGEKETKKIVNKKYREYYKEIYNVIKNGSSESFSGWQKVDDILDRHFTRSKSHIAMLLHFKNTGELEVEFNALVWSIIHMMFNRLIRSKQRKHEMVLYNFMHKYYQTELKLSANKKINQQI